MARRIKGAQENTEVFRVRLLRSQMDELERLELTEEMTKADLVRLAVQQFIEGKARADEDKKLSKYDERLKRMEQGLRSLIVKSILIQGQCLYYEMKTFSRGGYINCPGRIDGIEPREMSAVAFDNYWDESRRCAANFLRFKGDDLTEIMGSENSQ